MGVIDFRDSMYFLALNNNTYADPCLKNKIKKKWFQKQSQSEQIAFFLFGIKALYKCSHLSLFFTFYDEYS